MFCVKCGSENPAEAQFCYKCGKLLFAPEKLSLASNEESARSMSPATPAWESKVSPQLRERLSKLGIATEDSIFTEAGACQLGEGHQAPKQHLPYKWGKFQGWVSLIAGLFAALFIPAALLSGVPMDDKVTGYAVLSPLLIASGYAFVWRRRFAAFMTYLWIGFYVLVFIVSVVEALTNGSLTPEQQGHQIGKGLAQMIIGGLFWGLCAVYYRKRHSEFVET